MTSLQDDDIQKDNKSAKKSSESKINSNKSTINPIQSKGQNHQNPPIFADKTTPDNLSQIFDT